jgi:hypothetical protein
VNCLGFIILIICVSARRVKLSMRVRIVRVNTVLPFSSTTTPTVFKLSHEHVFELVSYSNYRNFMYVCVSYYWETSLNVGLTVAFIIEPLRFCFHFPSNTHAYLQNIFDLILFRSKHHAPHIQIKAIGTSNSYINKHTPHSSLPRT